MILLQKYTRLCQKTLLSSVATLTKSVDVLPVVISLHRLATVATSFLTEPNRRCFISLFLVTYLLFSSTCIAQNQPIKSGKVRTELSFELILSRTHSNPLAAQQWARIFKEFGVPLRVRQPKASDVAGVDQLIYGTVRRVKVLGQINRRGNLVLPDRLYTQAETAKLKEWIDELQLYGEQGAPKGEPLWGLKKAEFDRLHAGLIAVVEKETSGLSLPDALRAMELPEKYPLKFSVATRAHLANLENQKILEPVDHDVRKFSKGTALAMILRNYSLAFYPRRLPDESVELAIELIDENDKTWPIGWDPDSLNLKRLSLARKMYIAQVIEIKDLPLSGLVPKIRSETELDLFIDPHAIKAEGLKLEKLIINFPRKRTSWSLCLRTVLSKVKLTQQLRVDENNRPFIWITKFEPRKRAESK